MFTVPLLWKPFEGASIDTCPTCNTIHYVKTTHLWLDDNGECLVSKGVLRGLEKEGLALHGLSKVGTGVDKPPTLAVGSGETREAQDHANRATLFVAGSSVKTR